MRVVRVKICVVRLEMHSVNDQRVCGYPVCPAVAAACSAPRPLRSRWLTFAPFCSRNSQANNDPCRQHRQIQKLKTTGTREDLCFLYWTLSHLEANTTSSLPDQCRHLYIPKLLKSLLLLHIIRNFIMPPHPNSSSNQRCSSLLLSNAPIDLRPLGQRCCHGNQISSQRSPVQTQPGILLMMLWNKMRCFK